MLIRGLTAHLRDEEGRERRYRACEAEIQRLVREAWRNHWVVTVVVDEAADHERRRDEDDRCPLGGAAGPASSRGRTDSRLSEGR